MAISSAARRHRLQQRRRYEAAERPLSGAEAVAHDAASQDDAAWFLAHPGRNNRIRRPLFGEVRLDPDRLTLIFVRQVRPGVRFRFSFLYQGPGIPEGECPEYSAVLIFDDLMRTSPRMAAWFDTMRDVSAPTEAERGA
jgi:hypothetical protein